MAGGTGTPVPVAASGMSSLALQYSQLEDAVQGFLGVAADEDVDDVINAGYRWFLTGEYPDPRRKDVLFYHQWSFLCPWATLSVWPTTQTAAVTVGGGANTTLTVDADTFYESMVGHAIVADTSGTSYTITGYTDAKNITVSADASDDDGDTFTITADGLYQLPGGFGDIETPFTYAEGTGLQPILRTSEAHIRAARAGAAITGDPYCFDIVPRAPYTGYAIETAGTFWDLLLFPTPSALRVLTYQYKVMVSALDGETYIYPLGGLDFSQAILQCCLAKAEQMKQNVTGPQTALAHSELLAAVRRDAKKSGAKRLGRSAETGDLRGVRRWLNTNDVSHPW